MTPVSPSGHDPAHARPVVAVVVPCYRVAAHIDGVLATMGPEVTRIYCVDDACPERTGEHIAATCRDPRVVVLHNPRNLGVGGATMAGFARALADGVDIAVKVDGDGQMDPALIPNFLRPILEGRADYTKGNRFFDLSYLKPMPAVRLFGNAVLSLLTKLSTGYWNIADPNNGYVAIHGRVLAMLPFEKISQRYFFESDLLFRLSTLGAVIEEVPMRAVYAGETSSLKVGEVWTEFLFKNLRNLVKRIGYNYFLRGFSIASIEVLVGLPLSIFGVVFGAIKWAHSNATGVPVTAGTAMLAGLPLIVGVQMLLSFLVYDTRVVPSSPLHRRL